MQIKLVVVVESIKSCKPKACERLNSFSQVLLRNCFTKIIYTLLQTFVVTASYILSKEIFSNNTKHRKQISKFH